MKIRKLLISLIVSSFVLLISADVYAKDGEIVREGKGVDGSLVIATGGQLVIEDVTTNNIPKMGASGFEDSVVSDDGTTVTIQPGANSTTAFQVLDAAGGTPVLNVDTTNKRVGIGTASPAAKLDVAGGIAIGEGPYNYDRILLTQTYDDLSYSILDMTPLSGNRAPVLNMYPGGTQVDSQIRMYADSGQVTQKVNIEANGNSYFNGGNVGIGTTDLDGTPAAGRTVIKGGSNDGSTNILVGRDSDDANRWWVDTVGANWFSDFTDSSVIKHVQEPGLGGRLTVGLDETARTMVICDAGDVDTDLGLSAHGNPRLYIMNSTGTLFARIDNESVYSTASLYSFLYHQKLRYQGQLDLDAGDAVTFNSGTGIELTDTDGRQSWVSLQGKVNQQSTAAYNGLEIIMTETALGDGSTGTGGTNNLIAMGTSSDPDMFRVKNDGSIIQTVGANYRSITTPDLTGNTYSIAAGQYTVLLDDDDVDCTDTLVVTLPAAASNTGRILNLKKIGSSETVQLDGNSTETIDGALTKDLTVQYDRVTLQCDGSNWFVTSSN